MHKLIEPDPTDKAMGLAHDDKYLYVMSWCCNAKVHAPDHMWTCSVCGKTGEDPERWSSLIPLSDLARISCTPAALRLEQWFKFWIKLDRVAAEIEGLDS